MSMRRIGLIVAMIALIAGFAAGSVAAAQEATPSADAPEARPAHIHSGTCEELGDVVHPLNDISGESLDSTPEATPESEEEGLPGDVLGFSTTSVEASLDDLLAEEHAVNVHESAENIDVYIACGNIEGEPDEDGVLYVDLQQLNGSGVIGQVIISDLGDGEIEVAVTLTDAEAEMYSTPAATPEG